jgi:hypothetical protein
LLLPSASTAVDTKRVVAGCYSKCQLLQTRSCCQVYKLPGLSAPAECYANVSNFSDPVPDALVALFATTGNRHFEEPPDKRRKLSNNKATDINEAALNLLPSYMTLALIKLKLVRKKLFPTDHSSTANGVFVSVEI